MLIEERIPAMLHCRPSWNDRVENSQEASTVSRIPSGEKWIIDGGGCEMNLRDWSN